jgi:hypothetical protein
MEQSERRKILTLVADGKLSPEEAAERLSRAEVASQSLSLKRVRIDRQLRSVEIVGDPGVREAIAEGPHRARTEGDTLMIESEHQDLGGFAFSSTSGHRGWSSAIDGEHRLLVRMNPILALDLDVQAGSCRVRGVEGPIKADVQAGSLRIDGFKSPLQASVQAGSISATGVLAEGSSEITCEAGSVKLQLLRGSSVRIKAHSTLGKLTLPGPIGSLAGRGSWSEATIGGGSATLSIESTMGSITVIDES